MGGEERL